MCLICCHDNGSLGSTSLNKELSAMEPLVLKTLFGTVTLTDRSYKLESPTFGLDLSWEAPEWCTFPSTFTQTNGS